MANRRRLNWSDRFEACRQGRIDDGRAQDRPDAGLPNTQTGIPAVNPATAPPPSASFAERLRSLEEVCGGSLSAPASGSPCQPIRPRCSCHWGQGHRLLSVLARSDARARRHATKQLPRARHLSHALRPRMRRPLPGHARTFRHAWQHAGRSECRIGGNRGAPSSRTLERVIDDDGVLQ